MRVPEVEDTKPVLIPELTRVEGIRSQPIPEPTKVEGITRPEIPYHTYLPYSKPGRGRPAIRWLNFASACTDC